MMEDVIDFADELHYASFVYIPPYYNQAIYIYSLNNSVKAEKYRKKSLWNNGLTTEKSVWNPLHVH